MALQVYADFLNDLKLRGKWHQEQIDELDLYCKVKELVHEGRIKNVDAAKVANQFRNGSTPPKDATQK